MKIRLLLGVVALVATVTGALWWLRPWLFPPPLPEGILEAHGRIEATEVTVSSKLSGRIGSFPVAEGDAVRRGALIAWVSADEIEPRVAQASARAAAAAALVRMREEESQAQLAEASARLAAAQERLKQARARIEVLEHHVEKAGNDYRRDQELLAKGFISPRQFSSSENALRLVEGELKEARNVFAASQADVAGARAVRDGIARKTPALLRAVRDEASAAGAARDEVQVILAETRVVSPIEGTVVTKTAEAGEWVFPGRPLAVLVDLTRPYLRVYLPERDIGKVKLGDAARVFVDSFPGRPFEAIVTEVAKKAEFTPKDVHMPDERVTLVYSVKLQIANPAGLLKPGMPADALIRWRPDAGWGR